LIAYVIDHNDIRNIRRKKGKGLGCGFDIVHFDGSTKPNKDVEDALIILFSRNAKNLSKIPTLLSVNSTAHRNEKSCWKLRSKRRSCGYVSVHSKD
jgi:hypothetical protein